MTFRRTLLTLTFPVLSLVVAGCNPPVDEAGKGGGMAPAGTEAPKTPTHEPTPTDVKPKGEGAMPADSGMAPTPGEKPVEKPAEPPKTEDPKMEPPK